MATTPMAPGNGLLLLLPLSPLSNKEAVANHHHHQQQQQQGKTPGFLSLSLSHASKAIVKQRKTKQARQLDGAFQCRTCGRQFTTFQALGGHRTSHKRPRVRADGIDLLLGAVPGKGAMVNKHVVHRCHTCGMVFATGQALGGHMRRHRAAAEMETTTVGLAEELDDKNHEEGHRLCSTLIQFI